MSGYEFGMEVRWHLNNIKENLMCLLRFMQVAFWIAAFVLVSGAIENLDASLAVFHSIIESLF